MTWSLAARDAETGQLGIGVATCAFAVGARVPFAATGTGAVATQAFTNPFYGPRGLELLRCGASADEVVQALTAADEGRADRQVHVLDAAGRAAAYTGEGCVPWCGHLIGDGVTVAGNMLAGPDVVARSADAFLAGRGRPLAERLLAALDAGDAAGGDKRGRQSAALLVHDEEEYALVDIRVDDHPRPLVELRRLLGVNGERFAHYRKMMPSRANPSGIVGRAEVERRIAESIAAARG